LSIFNNETRLRVKDLAIAVLVGVVLWLGYTLWHQVRLNTMNINSIAVYLQKQATPKIPVKQLPGQEKK